MGTDAKGPKDRTVGRSSADAPRVIYVPRGDATPERELAALTAAYAFVIERRGQDEAAAGSGDAVDGTQAEQLEGPHDDPAAEQGSA